MKIEALKNLVVETIEDRKGQNLQVLDVRDLTSITDYMIIVSGTSSRHVKAMAENLITTAKEHQCTPLNVNGLQDGEWALVDLGDVVIHIMLAKTREYYCLEKLWTPLESIGPAAAAV